MVVLKTSSVNNKLYFGIHFTLTKAFILTKRREQEK